MTGLRRFYYGWWMIAGLCLTEPISWGVLVYAFSVCVVPMHIELGWTPAELNGAYTTGVIVSALVAIPLGWWLQHHGARGVMTAGSLLTVLALLGWSQSRSLPLFYGCFVLAGLAMAATLYEPAFAITAAWFRRRRARAVLTLTIAGGLGSTIFVPITGALISAYGWRHALVTLAVIVSVAPVPIHAFLLRRWPADLGMYPDGDGRAENAKLAAFSHRGHPGNPDQQRRRVLRSRSFRWITLGMVTNETGKFAISVTLVVYLANRGYSLRQASLLAGAVGGLQVIGRILCISLRSRIALHRSAAVLFTAQGLTLPIPLLTQGHDTLSTVTVAVMLVFFGLAFGLPDLMRGTLVADYYGATVYAGINGVLSAFLLAARAAGPLLAGLVATLADTAAPVLAGGALLAIVSAEAFRRAHHTRAREHIAGAEFPSPAG